MTNDYYKTTEPEIYEDPPLPVDPRDEEYSEICEEVVQLRALIKRAADALETYPTWSRPATVQLISELRKNYESN
jgi:hypothetical protein